MRLRLNESRLIETQSAIFQSRSLSSLTIETGLIS